jgi:hypothetical protein
MTMCNAVKTLFVFGPVALASLLSCKGLNVAQGGTDVLVALKDVTCVIDTYSTEVQGGVTPVQAGVDAASKCNVASDVTSTLLASHVAGMQREARPQTPCAVADGGAPIVTAKGK